MTRLSGLRLKRRDFLRYGAIGFAAALAPGDHTIRAGSDTNAQIVACAIHPAIGIARVGNSPAEYFLGPDVAGPHPDPQGGYKDAAGRMKRQAARFRIYGLDADGNVVKEITAADAQIAWTVHLANKKAAWYNFEIAFDIPEATGAAPGGGQTAVAPLSTPRRNTSYTGANRAQLIIDPGPRSISGAGTNTAGGDAMYTFNTGRFLGLPVALGELRTDDQGRLLVLGGAGKSGSGPAGTVVRTFSNNDDWQDDVSDGPVEATVQLGDQTLQATGAWAVVAPPNFAPGIQSVVTMYDVIFEAATKLEPDRAPARPSFTRQIYPLLQRHVENQWVNEGFALLFGWGAPSNYLASDTLAQLADASDAAKAARTALFSLFRNPSYAGMQPNALPPYYGDNTTIPATTPRQWLAVLPIQYDWLQQWADGNFDADWPAGGLQYPSALEDLPLDEQPDALDRAVLDECMGGAFHPGCEMTWPMRVLSLYEAPFRLRRRQGAEPDWGDQMTSAIALGAGGPLSASGPGDLTRWMAVPWQTDTASCLSAYEPELDPYLPAFWPARVPNDVLTQDAFNVLLSATASDADKLAAFKTRLKWLRGQPMGRGAEQLARLGTFVDQWSLYGVITHQDGTAAGSSFPADIWVETARDPSLDAPAAGSSGS